MMNRARSLVALSAAAALATSACGNLSQDDLIFLAGVPPRETLALTPAGVIDEEGEAEGIDEGQALQEECSDGDLRCVSRNVAARLNGLTFFILAVIDVITQHPPTERKRGKRVWGPVREEDGARKTHRFEMIRLDSDPATFGFCLHAAENEIVFAKAADVTCDTDVDDSGLVRVLEGQFTPGEIRGARARSGSGSMTLEIALIPDLRALGKRMTIDFDKTGGRREIIIDVEGGVLPGTTTTRTLEYRFTRERDLSGTFSLGAFGNVAEDRPGLEFLDIQATWLADQSGRAEAAVFAVSDLENPIFELTQCWDPALETVYLQPIGPDGVGPAPVGSEDQCSIQQALR